MSHQRAETEDGRSVGDETDRGRLAVSSKVSSVTAAIV